MQTIEDLQKYTPETEKVDTQEKEKQRRRRTKKDTEASREHVCATCGKSYLSYPALYTHNKQKHEGAVRRKDSENSTSVSPVIKLVELLGSGELPVSENDLFFLLGELLQQDLKDDQKPFQYLKSDYTPTSAYGALTQYLDEKSKILDYQGIQYILFFIFTFRRSIENCDTKEIADHCNKAYMDFLKLLEKDYSDRGWIKQIIQKFNIQSIMQQIILDFCQWLYEKELTDDKVSLKN
ncbi:hypothetical protein pb186bvf_004849 [Paramecium bursaria]